MARRRARTSSAGGLGALLLVLLVGGFAALRLDPSLQANLPPAVRTTINSINLPTGIPVSGAQPTVGTVRPGGNAQIGVRSKTTGCQAVNSLPDSGCTPGAVFPNITVAQICHAGYAGSVRNVPDSEKNEAYTEYGITSHASGQYEVDHLISLELGGSNDIANLWPEAADPTPGFHEKDKVENYLHDQVCSGRIGLQQAQQQIATNWLAVYEQIK